jgi:hypothetical protein
MDIRPDLYQDRGWMAVSGGRDGSVFQEDYRLSHGSFHASRTGL